jgi:hypothetical protein
MPEKAELVHALDTWTEVWNQLPDDLNEKEGGRDLTATILTAALLIREVLKK